MKIILIRPHYDSHIITPPIGLGYLASYLKNNGHEALIIDALRDHIKNNDLVDKIKSENPDIVGITCLTAFYNQVVELCNILKENNIRCFVGGIHTTFLPYKTLVDSNADFVICGEGEKVLLDLVENNFVNNNIQGVYSKDNLLDENQPIVKSKTIENLDDIPFPDWEQIDPNLYPVAPHGAIVKNYPVGVVVSSRGCPYECAFCASPGFYDRKIRFRSPENVVDEIEYLVKKFGVKEIHFEDDNLTLNREHIEKICNLIIEKNIKISWACPNGIRADKIDEELALLMKKSGCHYFSFGIESASPEILSNIKKRETIETIEKAIEISHKVGMTCNGFFIFGLPGENKESLETTVKFAVSSNLSRAQFSILDVLPGSELWDSLKNQFEFNWNKKSYKEPEWLPESISREELMKAQTRAFRIFYYRFKILFRLLKLIKLNQIRFLMKRAFDYRFIK